MAKIADWKHGLLGYLKQAMEPYGFRKLHQSFYRKVSMGRQILHIAFIQCKDEVEIKVDVAIRHEELEKLYKTVLDEAEEVQTATIGTELERLTNRNSMIWTLNDQSLIPIIGIDILSSFWEIGWPFLEKYASLEKIYDLLLADELPIRDYCLIDHVRAEKALVAAFLLKRKDIDNLLDAKTSYLLKISNPYLKDFLEFVVSFKSKLLIP